MSVEDGVFTSSVVSAGIDMDLGLMAKRFDYSTAGGVARGADYERNAEKSRDPFR